MVNRKVFSWIILAAAILYALFVGFSVFAHGSVINRPNSIGITQFYTNPNMYMFGAIIGGRVMDGATVVTFQPYETMALYTEPILFCGDVSEQFNGKSGAVLVTYSRVAHRLFRGVACHEIVSVFEVHDDQEVVKP